MEWERFSLVFTNPRRAIIILLCLMSGFSRVGHGADDLASISIADMPDTFTYFVYHEAMGVYQSERLQASEMNVGFINEIILEVFQDHAIEWDVQVMPALRAVSFMFGIESKNVGPWIGFSFTDQMIELTHEIRMDGAHVVRSKNPLAQYRLKLFHHGEGPAQITRAEALSGKKVVMISSLKYPQFDKAFSFVDFERIQAQRYSYALKMLLARRADFFLVSKPALSWQLEAVGLSPDLLVATDIPIVDQSNNRLSLMWGEVPDSVSQYIETRLQDLKQRGRLDQLIEKYHFETPRKH